jgi:hypothetical protein
VTDRNNSDSWVDKLVQVSSPALSTRPPILSSEEVHLAGNLSSELTNLLSKKNGFYAFESALHIFPASELNENNIITLGQWNKFDLWREIYEELTEGLLFFAEDIFGVQFCIGDNRVYSFDPESADREEIATDLESWARQIMNDYEYLTGFPLAHQWQLNHGPLAGGLRLLPKKLFVMGGEFAVENLYPLDSVEGMRFRGSIAVQIHNLSDGEQVKIHLN